MASSKAGTSAIPKSGVPDPFENYRTKIKKLKTLVARLQGDNENLNNNLGKIIKSLRAKGVNVTEASYYEQKAVLIQSHWRGHQTRKLIRENPEQYNPESRTNKQESLFECAIQLVARTMEKKIGLTLEMVFRALDKGSSGEVNTEEFKNFIISLNLPVPLSTILRTVYLFDELCTGKIKKEEFQYCLQSYGIFKEKIKKEPQTIDQKSFIKLFNLIKSKSLSPEKLFQKADIGNKGYLTQSELKLLMAQVYEVTPLEREVRSIMNILDVNLDAKAKKAVFLRELHLVNKIQQGEDLAGILDLLDDETDATYERPFMINKNVVEANRPEFQEIKELINIYEDKTGRSFHQVFEFLLENNKEPEKGYSLRDIMNAIESQFPEINKEDQKQIFKTLDRNQRGVSELREVRKIFSELSSKISIKLLLLIIARTLRVIGQLTDKYLQANGILPKEQLSLNVFLEKFSPLFGLSHLEATELYKKLLNDKTGSVSAETLISKINVYRGQEELDEIRRKNLKAESEQNYFVVEEKAADNAAAMVQKPPENPSKNLKDMQVSNPYLEVIKKLKNELKKCNLTHDQMFLYAQTRKNVASLSKMREYLKEKLNAAPKGVIDNFFKVVEVNRSPEIGRSDFDIIMMTEEWDNRRIKPDKVDDNFRREIIEKFVEFFKEKHLSPIDFFLALDEDKSGEVTFFELRNGLIRSGFAFGRM